VDKFPKMLAILIAVGLCLPCSFAGCDTESEDKGKKPSADEKEKVAFLFDGELGGMWCVDEVRLYIDGEEVVKALFESDKFPPTGWEVDGFNYEPYTWFQGEPNLYITEMHEGEHCAQIWSEFSRQLEYLVLPEFDEGEVSKAESVELEFWVAGAATLCDYACLKVVVYLPKLKEWLEAYVIDTKLYRADDYEWTKIAVDLTDPEQFYEEEEEL